MNIQGKIIFPVKANTGNLNLKEIEMRKKRTILTKEDLEEKIDIQFCTECGDALEYFDQSEQAKDPEAVKKNFENCKKTGKFKGEVCSKLYIISPSVENKE